MEQPTKQKLMAWARQFPQAGYTTDKIDYLLVDKSPPSGGTPFHVRNRIIKELEARG
jgi:hypothetical protein